MTKIDRKLNLAIPLEREDGTTLWIFSTPVRKEVFETYFLVLAKTFSSLTRNGLDPRSGPSVAALMLREVAMATSRDNDSNWWEGDDGIGGKTGLLAEIVRLSNCLVGTPDNGWQTMPLQEALDKKLVSDEEKSEVMNLLVFFTVTSLVAPKADRPILINGMAAIYRLQSTSSSYTEWSASLKTRTPVETSGEKGQASSDTTSAS